MHGLKLTQTIESHFKVECETEMEVDLDISLNRTKGGDSSYLDKVMDTVNDILDK